MPAHKQMPPQASNTEWGDGGGGGGGGGGVTTKAPEMVDVDLQQCIMSSLSLKNLPSQNIVDGSGAKSVSGTSVCVISPNRGFQVVGVERYLCEVSDVDCTATLCNEPVGLLGSILQGSPTLARVGNKKMNLRVVNSPPALKKVLGEKNE